MGTLLPLITQQFAWTPFWRCIRDASPLRQLLATGPLLVFLLEGWLIYWPGTRGSQPATSSRSVVSLLRRGLVDQTITAWTWRRRGWRRFLQQRLELCMLMVEQAQFQILMCCYQEQERRCSWQRRWLMLLKQPKSS